MTTNDDLRDRSQAGLRSGAPPTPDHPAPLRRLFADMLWDEAAASVRLDYDQTQTAEVQERVRQRG